MDNVLPEATEDQSVTSPSGESLGSNFHVRRSECIRKPSQQYNPVFGPAREWKNDAVAIIVYMIQDRYININVDMDGILSLLAELDAEYCIYTPSTFHMRESYVIKSKIHDPDTRMYTEALSSENPEEYFKAMYDGIKSIIRRDKWEIVSRKSVDYHNVLQGTCSFKSKNKPDWKIRKFKAQYCVR